MTIFHYLPLFSNTIFSAISVIVTVFHYLPLFSDTIFFCDSFHGEKENVHTVCSSSFKKKYWLHQINRWAYQAKDINTASAEQINAKIRNLQNTVHTASMSYFQDLFVNWAALNNMVARGDVVLD